MTPEPATPADWTTGVPALLVRECESCGNRWYLPRSRCPSCGGARLRARTAVGTGVVVAVTRLPQPQGEDIGIALVDLDDGARVMGHAGAEVAIGDRVTLSFPAQPPQPRFDRIPVMQPATRRTD